MDDHFSPCPLHVAGELCIAGTQVGRGYRNLKEMTEEKFLPNPFDVGRDRLYRTGDLAYWKTDGKIGFLGRKDGQVKLRGFRIELGSIEDVILGVDEIEQCCVIVERDTLIAYCVGDVEAEQLKAGVSKKLPPFMVPSHFIFVSSIPRTGNGKLDKKALKALYVEPSSQDKSLQSASSQALPKTNLEKAICSAFKKALKKEESEEMFTNQKFFDLGGNSITAMKLGFLLKNQGYDINVTSIISLQSVKNICDFIESNKNKSEQSKRKFCFSRFFFFS